MSDLKRRYEYLERQRNLYMGEFMSGRMSENTYVRLQKEITEEMEDTMNEMMTPPVIDAKAFDQVTLSKYDNAGKRLGDHETLMMFNNDGGNYAFNEWWFECGSRLFNEWCLNSEEYNCEATK